MYKPSLLSNLLWDDRSGRPAIADAVRDAHLPDEAFPAQVFARLFEDAPAGEPDHTAPAHEALECAEWDELQTTVAGDADLSALATAGLMAGFDTPLDDDMADNLRAARIRGRLRETADKMQKAKFAVASFGGATDMLGEPGDPIRSEIIEQIASDEAFRRILDLVGGLLADGDKTITVDTVIEEITSTTLGNNIAHLLPMLRSQLGIEIMEDIVLQKIIENRAEVFKFTGSQKSGRGDIVLLLDVSSSMRGDPFDRAKAVALATMLRATMQNRRCIVLPFSGRVHDPIENTPEGVLALQRLSARGTTNLHKAIQTSVQYLTDKGDIMIITDGLGEVSVGWREAFEAADARLFALAINGGAFCDEIKHHAHLYVNLDTELKVVV